jgi:hypothetical protein
MDQRLHTSFFFVVPFNAVAATSAMLFSATLMTALALVQRHNGLTHQKNPDEIVSSHQFWEWIRLESLLR